MTWMKFFTDQGETFTSSSVTVVIADWISARWACWDLQRYAVEGSVLLFMCVFQWKACVLGWMYVVCACLCLCVCLLNTCLLLVCLCVCLNMSVCQGVEESDTHALGRRDCVGWRVCPELDSPSPSLSVSRYSYCACSDTAAATNTVAHRNVFLHRHNADPCWREWHKSGTVEFNHKETNLKFVPIQYSRSESTWIGQL